VTNDQPETETPVAVHEPAAPTKATSEEHELEHHGIDADEGQVGVPLRLNKRIGLPANTCPTRAIATPSTNQPNRIGICGAIACIDTGGAIGNGGVRRGSTGSGRPSPTTTPPAHRATPGGRRPHRDHATSVRGENAHAAL